MHDDLNEKILKIESANNYSEYAQDMTSDQIEDEYAELKKKYQDFDADEYASDTLEMGADEYFGVPTENDNKVPPDGELGMPDGPYNPKSRMEAGADSYFSSIAGAYPETDFTPYHSTAKYTMIPDPEDEDVSSMTES